MFRNPNQWTPIFIWGLVLLFVACNESQKENKPNLHPDSEGIIGGGCDGCELMYIGMPSPIESIDTSPGWPEKGQKLLVTGTVYQTDGRTPAPGIIIYYWQTDHKGYYSPTDDMDPRARRHGHIRGWVKTDADGKYAIYTIRPSPYPNDSLPAHIHISIKEPGIGNEYYIDELVFDDDTLLTGRKRRALENRGGSGILRVLLSDSLQIAGHNIVLGLNIPGYPVKSTEKENSGLHIGEDAPSFMPFHAWGPDKGTRTCPVCKYGRYHGILYFVGNIPDWTDIKKWLIFLEKQSIARSKYLKVYFIYGNKDDYTREKRRRHLEFIGRELNLSHIALTFVPSMTDNESEVNLYKINPEVANTFILYRHRAIIEKWIDLKAGDENYRLVSTILDKTRSDYFDLSEPRYE